MAQLVCSVITCGYNKEKRCSKGDIMVGGSHADTGRDTCCESFRPEGCDCYTSALERPCEIISIDCEATNCKYNSNYKCHAGNVSIEGSRAKENRDTLCGTFACEC
jgi:hypothetical protein